ncbi:MAG: hypothetical protein DI552_00660 [Brevundimonas sp.]|uniref:hypothetical protein n=1 Tax=Brevundimonas sp. TaxID=1871086 RepID=UPI000DBBC015|nr:hypothetical protein [Brevundimonas sp.]PZU62244.1 MAG: hypothetical protein DI552_00660 [Brevundimonas sp.]
MAQAHSDTERRMSGAQARLLAKMSEFSGWAITSDEAGMNTCRMEASALLESYFDLSQKACAELLAGGR